MKLLGSALEFLRIGVIEANFNSEGTVAADNEELIIAVIMGEIERKQWAKDQVNK